MPERIKFPGYVKELLLCYVKELSNTSLVSAQFVHPAMVALTGSLHGPFSPRVLTQRSQ
jgi:hypothetical protein